VVWHAGGHFRGLEIASPDVSKNFNTAWSSNEGEFATSTTT